MLHQSESWLKVTIVEVTSQIAELERAQYPTEVDSEHRVRDQVHLQSRIHIHP